MTERSKRIVEGFRHCNTRENSCEGCPIRQECFQSGLSFENALSGFALEVIDELQSQWTPVTQRLPKNYERVIVTFEQKYGDSKYGVAIDCVKNGKWHWEEEFPEGDIKIVAWMPFPKPWSGEVK